MLEATTLLGSSSGRNAGDAALLSGLMDSVDEACGTRLLHEIPTIRPGYIRKNYENRTRPVSMMPWNLSVKMLGLPTWRSILRTDVSLLFDAILFDRSLYNPLFNFMSTLYVMLPRARKRGKKMAFFNVGTGPVDSEHGRRMLLELSEIMDFITVRDPDSLEILRDLGVRNPRILLCADAALTVRSPDDSVAERILRREGLDPGEEILGININAYIDTWARPKREPMGKEAFLRVLSGALKRFLAEVPVPVLFVSTQHHDVGITRELIAALPEGTRSCLLSNVDYNHYEVKACLRKASLLFGMRLHSLILASSELTPVVGLAYQPKVEYYLKSLGQPECCLLFSDFHEERLSRLLLEAWERRGDLRARLETRIPELKALAHKAGELVGALHRGEDLDAAFARVAEGATG